MADCSEEDASWKAAFKLIHGKTPTKADREQLKTPRAESKQKEKKPYTPNSYRVSSFRSPAAATPSAAAASSSPTAALKPPPECSLKRPKKQSVFESPSKQPETFVAQSPQASHWLRTPSPKKLLRPTAACRNVRFLLEAVDENKPPEEEDANSDDEAAAQELPVFEDERPNAAAPPAAGSRKRKAPTENFVRINMKRKRFAPKGKSSKKFSRHKKRRLM